ncbi:hypothetical protein BJ742DRAFT_210421 [Cladochytrium replicatum]|nr:hypothetical protein BJ742DRAFT_210421 [Cladochytrium replicatum]
MEKLRQKQLVIESLQERVLNLGSRATIQKNEIRRLNEVETRQKVDITRLDSVVRQLHDKFTELDCQRRNAESKLKSAVAQLNVRENTIQTLRSKLEANESLLKTYQDNANSTDGLKDALKKARADLSKKDGLVRGWATKCENLSKELQATRKDVEDSVRSRVGIAKKSEELKEEVRMLKGRLEQCERAFRRTLEIAFEERDSHRRQSRREVMAAEREKRAKEKGDTIGERVVGDEVWMRAKDISKRILNLDLTEDYQLVDKSRSRNTGKVRNNSRPGSTKVEITNRFKQAWNSNEDLEDMLVEIVAEVVRGGELTDSSELDGSLEG